jgi:hypothetical protein
LLAWLPIRVILATAAFTALRNRRAWNWLAFPCLAAGVVVIDWRQRKMSCDPTPVLTNPPKRGMLNAPAIASRTLIPLFPR